MHANGPVPSNHDSPGQPAQGLPPVKPPSGRFILQLFLIPGLIVAGLVMVFVFGGLAWVGSNSPESILGRIDSNNEDIRWRAAHELAQVLKRPESLELASDPTFALDIAERLDRALADLEASEYAAKDQLKRTLNEIDRDKSLGKEDKEKRADAESLAAWRRLDAKRNLVLFLTSSMGDFNIPVGVHVLCDMVMKDKSAEEKGLALKRRRAVWALANLGDNMQRHYFGKNAKPEDKVLNSEQKAGILAKLEKEAARFGKRGDWARTALEVLQKKRAVGVDAALEICVRGNDKIKAADDPYLRELVAFALNFWDGDRVEPTLLWLSRDDGHGKRIEIGEAE
jgi:hypothetical protein